MFQRASSKIAQLGHFFSSNRKNHFCKTCGFTEFVCAVSFPRREKETIFVTVLFPPPLNFTGLKAYIWMNQWFVGEISQAGTTLLLFLGNELFVLTSC